MQSAVLDRVAIPAPSKIRSLPNLKTMAFVGAGLTVALGGSWYGTEWWRVGRFIEATDDAYAGGNVTSVSPHVAGFIAEIPVSDNQHVAAGQLLIRLDARDFRAALDRAQAIADERQATLAGLEAKYVLQQQLIAKAEAELSAKAAQAAFAREDAVRYRNLAATSYGSRQNAERASAADQEAQSATKAAEAALAAARQQMIVLQAEIAAARAGVAQAKADLETARLNLGYTEIRSPIDGYVGNRAGAGRRLCRERRLSVERHPGAGALGRRQFQGRPARANAAGPAGDGRRRRLAGPVFHGHVESLAPGTGAIFSVIPPENATGNFTKIVQRVPVRIALDDADARLGALRPGLSTTVSVDTRRSTKGGE